MKTGNQRLAAFGNTIFDTMSTLAREHGAINLGQGFPDEDGPLALRERAAKAILDGPNQYPPMRGLPELREAAAAHDRRFYKLDWNPASEVLVTSGGTEALACAFLGLIEPGDEVVVFEPTYDSYRPMAERAGATIRSIRLAPPHWNFTEADLRAAFSKKTKLCVLNSPMNPTGKVFSERELDIIARCCVEFDTFAVCDEVYRRIVFDGLVHTPLATRAGMRERAVRIASGGKNFSLTGWKVGIITAAESTLVPIIRAHQFVTFTTPPALQLAVADGLNLPDAYFVGLARDLQAKRDLLRSGLATIGFPVADCGGTYFIGADHKALVEGKDDVVARRLVKEGGVATVPFSAFYTSAGGIDTWLRFAFCKREPILRDALSRLTQFFAR